MISKFDNQIDEGTSDTNDQNIQFSWKMEMNVADITSLYEMVETTISFTLLVTTDYFW